MKKYAIIGITMVCEIYGCVILACIYTIKQATWVLISLICAILLVCISSFVFTYLLKDKKEIKKDNSGKCPYFIEKYDDMNNPEYIDKEIR